MARTKRSRRCLASFKLVHQSSRVSAVRMPVRMLSRRLRFSLAAVSATAIFVFCVSGQIASALPADEPAEPLPPYARTGFAFGVDKTGVVLVGGYLIVRESFPATKLPCT
jgi:hypothetical protein